MKSVLQKKVRRKEVFFDGFSVGDSGKAGSLIASSSKNCVANGGALKRSVGTQLHRIDGTAVLVSETINAEMFLTWDTDENGNKRERIGYISEANEPCIFTGKWDTFMPMTTVRGEGAIVPAMEKDGKCKTIFVGATGVWYLSEDNLVKCADIACQAAGCFGMGRVFSATNDYYLVYSAPFEPTNFEESVEDGGKIALRHDFGKIVAMTMLKNRLCVLYENGISMLEVGGGARSFVRKDVEYSGGKILGKTLCVGNVLGEKAYFMAEDGVYAFDGTKLEKICKNLPIRAQEAKGEGSAVIEGAYYVTFKDLDGAWKTYGVDLESGLGYETFYMRSLAHARGRSMCRHLLGVHLLSGVVDLPYGEEACFTLAKTNFSVAGEKTLIALRFSGKGEFDVEISSGKKSKAQTLAFADGYARMPLALRGRTFSLTIKPKFGAEIYNATAEMQVLA